MWEEGIEGCFHNTQDLPTNGYSDIISEFSINKVRIDIWEVISKYIKTQWPKR